MTDMIRFVIAALLPFASAMGDPPDESAALVQESIVAGSEDSFLLARHLVLRGSNLEIGAALGRIAKERHRLPAPQAKSELRTAARRVYFERTFPILAERMRGAASAYGIDAKDDRFDFSSLGYPISGAGCTVVFYPSSRTEIECAVLSRNFDFTTGTVSGRVPASPEQAAVARPYVIELYPDVGYPSIYLSAYDLLAGTIDGMNSEGLVVALLADGEIKPGGLDVPSEAHAGFGVVQILRYLLDTCANVEEAKLALLTAKHRYVSIPCHYVIADAAGRSFIWEHSAGRNQEFIFDGGGETQVCSNFMYSLHSDLERLPKESNPLGAFARYRSVGACIAQSDGPLTMADIVRANASAAPTSRAAPMPPSGVTSRNLWHSLYIPEKRMMRVDFYLDDEPKEDGGTRVVRSGYREFVLGGER